jgi:hypothetical protein
MDEKPRCNTISGPCVPPSASVTVVISGGIETSVTYNCFQVLSLLVSFGHIIPGKRSWTTTPHAVYLHPVNVVSSLFMLFILFSSYVAQHKQTYFLVYLRYSQIEGQIGGSSQLHDIANDSPRCFVLPRRHNETLANGS